MNNKFLMKFHNTYRLFKRYAISVEFSEGYLLKKIYIYIIIFIYVYLFQLMTLIIINYFKSTRGSRITPSSIREFVPCFCASYITFDTVSPKYRTYIFLFSFDRK